MVLNCVLDLHPTHLTFRELAQEVCQDPEDFEEGDAFARAVRDLTAGGLLRMSGVHVVPTRPAIYFRDLYEESEDDA